MKAAWAWHRARPWALGTNFLPRTAANVLELWDPAAFPLHLVWGRQDPVCPYEVAAPIVQERLPRATTHLIDACGPLPQMEQPEAFEALLFDEILGG